MQSERSRPCSQMLEPPQLSPHSNHTLCIRNAAARARRCPCRRTPCIGNAAVHARRCPCHRTPCSCCAPARARRSSCRHTPCSGDAAFETLWTDEEAAEGAALTSALVEAEPDEDEPAPAAVPHCPPCPWARMPHPLVLFRFLPPSASGSSSSASDSIGASASAAGILRFRLPSARRLGHTPVWKSGKMQPGVPHTPLRLPQLDT